MQKTKIRFCSKARPYPIAQEEYPELYNKYGPRLVSVTSITGMLQKFALVQWAANESVNWLKSNWPDTFEGWTQEQFEAYFNNARYAYKNIAEEAADTGTDFHSLAETYLRTVYETCDYDYVMPEGLDDSTSQMLSNFIAWCEKNEIQPLMIEQKIIGDGYGGRCDLVCDCKRFWDKSDEIVRCVMDIKTSKAYYDEMGIQLAAYQEASPIIELFDGKEMFSGIIRVNKTGTYSTNYKDYSKTHEQDYQSFLKLKDFFWLQNPEWGRQDEGEMLSVRQVV